MLQRVCISDWQQKNCSGLDSATPPLPQTAHFSFWAKKWKNHSPLTTTKPLTAHFQNRQHLQRIFRSHPPARLVAERRNTVRVVNCQPKNERLWKRGRSDDQPLVGPAERSGRSLPDGQELHCCYYNKPFWFLFWSFFESLCCLELKRWNGETDQAAFSFWDYLDFFRYWKCFEGLYCCEHSMPRGRFQFSSPLRHGGPEW